MTEIPELIALLHSFVGLAAVLVGFNSYIEPGNVSHDMHTIHLVEVYLGIFIGAVTFTSSLVAFGKLNGKISSAPLQLPAKHKLNLAALVLSFILMLVFVSVDGSGFILILMTLIALAFGWQLVASIGGADMPVVVSMLNSYSGWAAAAAGFMLSNDLLIVTGALVGSSGAILSYIMCKAMNRSFISVIAGGFGTDGSAAASSSQVTWDQNSYTVFISSQTIAPPAASGKITSVSVIPAPNEKPNSIAVKITANPPLSNIKPINLKNPERWYVDFKNFKLSSAIIQNYSDRKSVV